MFTIIIIYNWKNHCLPFTSDFMMPDTTLKQFPLIIITTGLCEIND